MTLDALLAQIDATVNPLGQPPKTTGPGLNAVLHRLAEAATAPAPAAPGAALLVVATLASLPEVGTAAALYVVADTNQLYRWEAATFAYVPLTAAGASLGADERAALAAAHAPSATNAYATLADVAGAPVLATLPELTAARAGAQSFSLPTGAGGLLNLLVRPKAAGPVRLVYPTDYAVAQGVLSVGTLAGLQAGDHLSGTYYGTAVVAAPASGVVAPPAPATLSVPDLVTARVAEFVPVAGRTFLAYETTTDGGATWQPATGSALALPPGAVPARTYGVRVAATAEGVPASAATYVPALAAARYVPGLRARYFSGFSGFGSDFQQFTTLAADFEEVLVHAGRFRDPVFNNYGRQAPLDYFSVFFDGFLCITEPGTYSFGSGGDDATAMWLGEALQNPTGANRLDTGAGVVLAPGHYPIRLAYSEQAGAQYGDFYWNGPGVSDILNAGRLRLLTNQPFVPAAVRAPAGLLPDPDFDQPMRPATWAPVRGWDVVEGVLLGTDTDFTTTSFTLDASQLNDQYELEINLELAENAQLRVEFFNATPASTVLATSGVQRLALAPTDPSVQVRLRAENSNLVQVHYAQVQRLATAVL